MNTTTKKKFTLIISGPGSFSLSNDTDSDPMTDYSPGIWGIKSQKRAVEYALRYKNEGHDITVTCYDNPEHFALGNKLIHSIGLSQPLFKVVPPPPATVNAGNLKVGNLSALKRHLVPGMKVMVTRYLDHSRSETRETSVISCKGDNLILEKTLGSGIKSYVYFGKATDWTFDRTGATHHYLGRGTEGYIPTMRIDYLA